VKALEFKPFIIFKDLATTRNGTFFSV